jgi:hypothetical protein
VKVPGFGVGGRRSSFPADEESAAHLGRRARPAGCSSDIPSSDALPPGSSTVEVVLTPDGEDTVVVLTHRGVPPTLIGDHPAGWEHQLGRLPAAVG